MNRRKPSGAGRTTASDRAVLVDRIRRQIATGSYESDFKLDAAIRRLIDDLGLRPRFAVRPAAGVQKPPVGPALRPAAPSFGAALAQDD